MSMIPEDVIEQVRDSADLVGLIGESVNLKRTGSDYRGPCPFHGGKNRNFAVIPKRGMYYCFVCHESGDVFRWLMKRFGMDYPTAVRDIARRSGIVIPEGGSRSGPDPLEPLYSAVAAAQDWFGRQLLEAPEGQEARDYLAGREITLEQAGEHGLGWAPQASAFTAAMTQLGIEQPILLESGLLARREDGSVVPRFRHRLLFPIHDLRGRVVGFGGRLLRQGEPKYLNSPETPIFHKGRLLYNLHQAKAAIRQEQAVILVEGYFDVLRLLLAGVDHVVAPMGTGLTSEQAALLRRFAQSATLLYDSDEAGLKATFRAGDELLRHGVRVKVATMPPDEDPDTLVRKGGTAALAPVLRDAMDVLERKIQLLEQRSWFEKVERRREALDKLLPTIRAAADPVMRELYASRAAERVGVPREVVVAEAARAATAPAAIAAPRGPTDVRPRGVAGPPPARPKSRFGAGAERQLLRAMIASPEWRAMASRELKPELFEIAAFRELYIALAGLPATDAGGQLPEGLSSEAATAWAELRAVAAGLTPEQVSDDYSWAQETLAARPEYRAIARLTDAVEKLRRLADLDARYPAFARKRGYVRSQQSRQHRARG
ncbi:MAG TPA: DNA primase [Gemmatimonadales bacterium]|jgi:DNA primase|nr:DNA primase [Gemmatimonadales bacterium]